MVSKPKSLSVCYFIAIGMKKRTRLGHPRSEAMTHKVTLMRDLVQRSTLRALSSSAETSVPSSFGTSGLWQGFYNCGSLQVKELVPSNGAHHAKARSPFSDSQRISGAFQQHKTRHRQNICPERLSFD